ncbi:ComEA family DNA-binding protein [Balneola sp. MJW-20]|uniref:ComEA family DNA-binding protein n=1 Tax=Gracilimonas aurantiaca TaxID=3234185 RepID=UPI00346602C2
MIKAGTIVLGLILPLCIAAQGIDSLAIDDPAERWELQTEEGEADRILVWLETLMLNPLDMNRASVSDLMMLPDMKLETARALIDQREQRYFSKLSDLRKVNGISSAYLDQITPYIIVKPKITAASFTRHWKADWMSRLQRSLQKKEGYLPKQNGESPVYKGDDWKAFQRLSLYNDHLSMNLTLEKDPGEGWRQGTLTDHTSAHLALRDVGRLRQLVIGDFIVRGGQGLISAPVASMGKGREVTRGAIRQWEGIRPYGSAEETAYMRGAGISLGNRFRLEAWYSRRKLSASALNDSTFRMPAGTGLHRTQNELRNRARLERTTAGITTGYHAGTWEINIRGLSTRFDQTVSGGMQIYDRYDFSGRSHRVVGVDHKIVLPGLMILGEIALSDNRAIAFIQGIRMEWDSGTEWLLSYRNYSPGFQSLYGHAFAEGSGTQNEEGFYLGISQRVGTKWKFAAYADQFFFPAPRFGLRSYSRGYDVLGALEHRFGSGSRAEILFRSKVKGDEYKAEDDRGLGQIWRGRQFRQSTRFQIQHQLGGKLRMRTRLEWVRSRPAGEDHIYKGILLFQDIRWHVLGWLRADTRFTVFGSPDYSSRLYQFENDLLYVMTNTMLNDQGKRFYLLLKADAGENLELWFKYGVTVYDGLRVLGSGPEQIRGNRRSSVGLQLRVKV